MNDAPFIVTRRCDAGDCEPGCNCHLPIVAVDVDELTGAELAHFAAHGTSAQRALVALYLGPMESPMKKPRPVPFIDYVPSAKDRHGAECSCGDCRIPAHVSCKPGCGCLVCFVESLSARPAA